MTDVRVLPPELLTRPALGHFLASAEVQERRDHMRWWSEMAVIDGLARLWALNALAHVHAEVQLGRRLDLVAERLRLVADEMDAAPQMQVGGWPLKGYWLDRGDRTAPKYDEWERTA